MLIGTAELKIFNDHFGKRMDKFVSILTRCIIKDNFKFSPINWKKDQGLHVISFTEIVLYQLYCCNAYITFLVISRYVTSLTYCEDPEVIISGSGVSINILRVTYTGRIDITLQRQSVHCSEILWFNQITLVYLSEYKTRQEMKHIYRVVQSEIHIQSPREKHWSVVEWETNQ